MNIPDCYDPIYQAERREAEADRRAAMLPKCCFCERLIYPGNPYREHLARSVCEDCFAELEDNVRMEVEW